jgi:hypothetical protein
VFKNETETSQGEEMMIDEKKPFTKKKALFNRGRGVDVG